MLDRQGNILEKRDRQRIMLAYIESDPMMVASLQISKDQYNVIDKITNQSTTKTETNLPYNISRSAEQVSSVLASVEPLLNETTMYELMQERAKLTNYMIAVGSTNAAKPGDYIVETCSDTKSETYYDSESTDDDDGGYEVLLYGI